MIFHICISKRNTTDNKYGVNEGIIMTLIAKYDQVQIHEKEWFRPRDTVYKPLKLEVKGSCIKLLRAIPFCLYKIKRAHFTIDVFRNLTDHSFKSKVDKLKFNKHFMSYIRLALISKSESCFQDENCLWWPAPLYLSVLPVGTSSSE